MSARETAVRSLRLIRGIRDAQRQHAERLARDTQSAVGIADSERAAAKQDVDEALAAWFLVAEEGASFDPTLILSWTLALDKREVGLRRAEANFADAKGADERARANWQAAVTHADQASKVLATAQRYAGAYHEEKRLADQADLIAFRSMGR